MTQGTGRKRTRQPVITERVYYIVDDATGERIIITPDEMRALHRTHRIYSAPVVRGTDGTRS